MVIMDTPSRRGLRFPAVFSVFFVLLGVGIGYVLNSDLFPTHTSFVSDIAETSKTYSFVNPLLFCGDQNNVSNATANDLKSLLDAAMNTLQASGKLTDGSVYFRDLKNGPWASVNSGFKAPPASLLKVPLAMSIYKHAELKPGFLDTQLVASQPITLNQREHFKSGTHLVQGNSYSIHDLIGFMLSDSDNDSMSLLGSTLDAKEMEDSLITMGVSVPDGDGTSYQIDTKTFSSFFRVLYNASYLTASDSEQLLKILSTSTFRDGIVAGVPEGTQVSHKFGERYADDGTAFLSDCGIVYKENQPYALCIMTKGNNADNLAESIKTFSKIVYDRLEKKD